MWIDFLVVGTGGAIGTAARYLMSFLPLHPRSGFPLITLLINLAGAFCIGLIAALAGKSASFDPRLLLFLKVGLCGGFTTFSTFSLEALNLLQNGSYLTAAAYMSLSVMLCALAAAAGQFVVR